jgi:hypothetical protein
MNLFWLFIEVRPGGFSNDQRRSILGLDHDAGPGLQVGDLQIVPATTAGSKLACPIWSESRTPARSS